MNQTEAEHYHFKFIVVGDSGVGKTNFITRFCYNQFSLEPKVTVGVEYATKEIKAYDARITLHIWDTCGQENFKSISQTFYKGAVAALLMFDLTRRQTFENLEKWFKDVKDCAEENVSIMIVGNKSDLVNLREVRTEEGVSFAESKNAAYIETSALDSTNIEAAFRHVSIAVYNIFLQYGTYIDENTGKKSSKSFKLKSGEIIEKKCCGKS